MIISSGLQGHSLFFFPILEFVRLLEVISFSKFLEQFALLHFEYGLT